jgi:CBS domain-containing protein
MRCEDLMRRPVLYLRRNHSAAFAARRMREANVGFLPVCDDRGHVLGVLTDRDLALRVCATERSSTRTRVTDVMTREVIACRPEADVQVAEQLMEAHKKSRILVTSHDGKLQGVISLSDVARAFEPLAAFTLRAVASRESLRSPTGTY